MEALSSAQQHPEHHSFSFRTESEQTIAVHVHVAAAYAADRLRELSPCSQFAKPLVGRYERFAPFREDVSDLRSTGHIIQAMTSKQWPKISAVLSVARP